MSFLLIITDYDVVTEEDREKMEENFLCYFFFNTKKLLFTDLTAEKHSIFSLYIDG